MKTFSVTTGSPNGPVLFCLLASVVCRRRLSSSVTLLTGGRAAWAVGRPKLHGGSVRLRFVRATIHYRLEVPIMQILYGTKKTVFMHAAITPPKVNRFG